MRKTLLIAFEVLAGLALLAVVLVAILAWRLSKEPIDLDFLVEPMEVAINEAVDDFEISLGKVVIAWDNADRRLDLRLRTVTVRRPNGSLVAAVPEAQVALSPAALLAGDLIPTAILLQGARVTVVRRTDGTFGLGAGEDRDPDSSGLAWRFALAPDAGEPTPTGPLAPQADVTEVVASLLDEIAAPKEGQDSVAYLQRLEIKDAVLVLSDRLFGRIWLVRQAELDVHRDEDGIEALVSLRLPGSGIDPKVTARIDYNAGAPDLKISVDLARLTLAAIEPLAEPLQDKLETDLAISGRIDGTYHLSDGALTLDAELLTAGGTLSLPALGAGPFEVLDGKVQALVDLSAGVFEVTPMMLTLASAGDREVRLGGSLFGSYGTDGARIELEVTVDEFDLAALPTYWPEGDSNARAWVVENIPSGLITEASLDLAVQSDQADFAGLDLAHLSGSMRYRDLEIHYLRPMPPILGAGGTVVFDPTGFDFRVETGEADGVVIEPSRVQIWGIETGNEKISIELQAFSSLSDTLELLDREPLGLIRKLGLDPADITGKTREKVNMAFPLLNDLTFDEIALEATATIADLAMKNVVAQLDVTGGNVSLAVDKFGLHLWGPVTLDGVPVDADWREDFRDSAKVGTRLNASAAAFPLDRLKAFGVDVAPYATGSPAAKIELVRDTSGPMTLDGELDLRNARLEIDTLNWSKPVGEAGTGTFQLLLEDERLKSFRRFALQASDLSVSGQADFSDQEELETARLDHFKLGLTDLQGFEVERKGDSLSLRTGGRRLDLRGLVAEAKGEPPPGVEPGGSGDSVGIEAKTADTVGSLSAFEIQLNEIDRVDLDEDRYLQSVTLELTKTDRGYERAILRAQIPTEFRRSHWHTSEPPPTTPAPVDLTFGPNVGGYSINATTADAGALLRLLGVMDTANGGTFSLKGATDQPLFNSGVAFDLEVANFVLVDAPILAKIASLASLTGIVDTMRGDGIRFQRLTGSFLAENRTISSDLMRMYGPAIGLTAAGTYDLKNDTLDLRGTFVPAYSINRVLGAIPILGWLLTGGEGEGLLGVIYSVDGPIENPTVTVNPLSLLTPGFLRNLFDIFEPASEADKQRTKELLTLYPPGNDK